MKKSDVYEIAIKILGLYLVVIVLTQLKDILTSFAFILDEQNNPETFQSHYQAQIFIGLLIPFIFLVAFTWVLIFKTKIISGWISGKSDYEETAKLFTDRRTIYEIALVLVGLVTIILTLPEFLFRFFDYIQSLKIELHTDVFEVNYLIISVLKLIIGFIAIAYSKQLSDYLGKKKKDEDLL